MNHKRVLIISDCHFPFAHKDWYGFLSKLKKKYKPTTIIHIVDKADMHSINVSHVIDPDLPSPKDEYELAKGTTFDEKEKVTIRSYSYEGKTTTQLKNEFESLRIDTTMSLKLRQFLEYQIEKISVQVANEAIQRAACIHQKNEHIKATKLKQQNPPTLYQLSKLHSESDTVRSTSSSKYNEEIYNYGQNNNNDSMYNTKK